VFAVAEGCLAVGEALVAQIVHSGLGGCKADA
jgi:hypothetical protein